MWFWDHGTRDVYDGPPSKRRDATPGYKPGQIPGVLILRFVHDCLDVRRRLLLASAGELTRYHGADGGGRRRAYRQCVALVHGELLVDGWTALLTRGYAERGGLVGLLPDLGPRPVPRGQPGQCGLGVHPVERGRIPAYRNQ